jgi:hypothetical protein
MLARAGVLIELSISAGDVAAVSRLRSAQTAEEKDSPAMIVAKILAVVEMANLTTLFAIFATGLELFRAASPAKNGAKRIRCRAASKQIEAHQRVL